MLDGQVSTSVSISVLGASDAVPAFEAPYAFIRTGNGENDLDKGGAKHYSRMLRDGIHIPLSIFSFTSQR